MADGRGRTEAAVVVLVFTVAAFAVHARAFDAPFLLDARVIVLGNPFLRAASLANVVTLFTHDYWHPVAVNGLYRPLAQLTYLVDWSVLGHADAPRWYRIENLGLHVICMAFAAAVARRLAGDAWIAAAAVGCAVLHPVATEIVTNVVGRADLLATCAVLAGVWCTMRAVDGPPASAWRWWAGTFACAAIGPFAKESAIVLPVLVLAWEALLSPRSWGAIARSQLGFAAALLPWAFARHWTLAHEWASETSVLDNPLIGATFWVRVVTAVKGLALQLWTLLWPATLSIDYSFDAVPLVTSPADPGWLAGLVLVGAAIAAFVWTSRRRPAIAFAIAAYAIAVLPTANLVMPVGAILADRFAYLPCVALAWCVAAAVPHAWAPTTRRAVCAGLCLAAVALGARTWVRNGDWRSDEALWASTVAAVPRSAKAHRGWATALFERTPDGANVDAAVAEIRQAIAIAPDFSGALADLGFYLRVRGDRLDASRDVDGARRAWRDAVAAGIRARDVVRRDGRAFARRMRAHGRSRSETPDAGDPNVFREIAQAHIRLGHWSIAAAALRMAQRLDPWNPEIVVDLSAVHALAGRFSDAAVDLWTVLGLNERHADAQARLVEVYRRIDPTWVTADARGAHVSLDLPAVREHRCRAFQRLADVFQRSRLGSPAAQLRRAAATACAGITPAS